MKPDYTYYGIVIISSVGLAAGRSQEHSQEITAIFSGLIIAASMVQGYLILKDSRPVPRTA